MRLPPLYPFLRILTCCSVLSEPVWSQLRESKRQIKGNRYRSTTVTSTAPMNRRRQQRPCDAGCLNEARAVLEPAADTERSRRGLPAPPASSSRPRHASIAKGGRCCPIRRRLGRVAGQRPCRRTRGGARQPIGAAEAAVKGRCRRRGWRRRWRARRSGRCW